MIAAVPILLRHENSPELQFVPFNEFALKKNNSIRLKSLNNACPECLRFYYIPDGKSDWIINSENYTFYPANGAIILPGQELYAEEDYLETGSLYWLHLHLNIQKAGCKNAPGKLSNISPYLPGERASIWDVNTRGVYFGINIKHERQHLSYSGK